MEIENFNIFDSLEFFIKEELSKVKNKKNFTCPFCTENSGFIYMDESVKKCKREYAMNLYNLANIPARFSKCKNTTYDNGEWQIRERTIQDALEYSVEYIKNFPSKNPPFFIGSTGLGKTHLSISIISELTLKYNKKCFFKQFRDLISDIKDIYIKNASEKDYIDSFNLYDVLIIDDLGSTRMSEWEMSILDTIIAERYNAAKHTIFSSNLSFLGSKIYKQKKEDKILDYKIGERNISRIFEMCKILELKGTDFRKKIKM